MGTVPAYLNHYCHGIVRQLLTFQVVAIQFCTDQLQGAPSTLVCSYFVLTFMAKLLLPMQDDVSVDTVF